VTTQTEREEIAVEVRNLARRLHNKLPGASSILYGLAGCIVIEMDSSMAMHVKPYVEKVRDICIRADKIRKARLN